MRVHQVALALAVPAMGTGCFTIGLTQPASTLGKDKWEIAAEARYQPPAGGLPAVSFRYGVADSIDVGVRATANVITPAASNLELQSKFQLTPKSSSGVVSLAPAINAGGIGMGGQLSVLLGAKVGRHELVLSPHVAVLPIGWGVGTDDFAEQIGIGAALGFYARVHPNFRLMPEIGFRALPWSSHSIPYGQGPIAGEISLALLFGN